MANHPWLQEVRNVAAIVQAAEETLASVGLASASRRRVEAMRDDALDRLSDLLVDEEADSVLERFVG